MADGQDDRDLMTPSGASTPGGQDAHSIAGACVQMRETEEGAPLNWCRAEAEQAARNPSAAAVAGEEIRHKAQELTEQGREMAAAYYQQGREHVHAWQQQLTDHVREHPLQSLLIVAGLGVLVGVLRRR